MNHGAFIAALIMAAGTFSLPAEPTAADPGGRLRLRHCEPCAILSLPNGMILVADPDEGAGEAVSKCGYSSVDIVVGDRGGADELDAVLRFDEHADAVIIADEPIELFVAIEDSVLTVRHEKTTLALELGD